MCQFQPIDMQTVMFHFHVGQVCIFLTSSSRFEKNILNLQVCASILGALCAIILVPLSASIIPPFGYRYPLPFLYHYALAELVSSLKCFIAGSQAIVV